MKEFYYRHLPHWQPRGAVLFVTFRLKNSLPIQLIESLREERESEKILLQQLPASELARQIGLEQRRYFEKWDGQLDKTQYGPHWLAQPEIAGILKEALHYRDGKVFDLHAFCIMSNQAHVLFEPLSRSGWQPDHDRSKCQSDLRM